MNFFYIFISHAFVGCFMSFLFLLFYPSCLGGFWLRSLVAILGEVLLSDFLFDWIVRFNISLHGLYYWLLYYSLLIFGSLLGILMLRFFSQNNSDL